MKYLILLVTLFFSLQSIADDYKTAQRFEAGDVLSADVVNDILDRIELALRTINTSELIGIWDVTWKTCLNGGPGNCSGLNVGAGWSSGVDNLYRTRSDEWTISDDGDGTFSVSISKYCISGASGGAYYNDPCVGRIIVDDGILLFGTESGNGVSLDSDHTEFYDIRKISNSRFQLWQLKSGSNSFVSYTLDKKALPPNTPSALSVVPTSSSTTPSWTANTVYAIDAVIKSGVNTYTVTTAGTTASVAPIHTDGAVTDGTTALTFKEVIATGTAASVTLSWTEGDATETNYDIQRKTSAEGTYASVGMPVPESFVDSTVTTGTTYWYRVFAINSNGTSLGSNVVNIAL